MSILFDFYVGNNKNPPIVETRPDTRLPQLSAGGQGLNLRSFDHLGKSSEAIDRKKTKKVKCDGRTDGRTDRQSGV